MVCFEPANVNVRRPSWSAEEEVPVRTYLTSEDLSRLSEFLAPAKIAVVATIGRDGVPQLTPNWYVYRDGKIAISTTKQRVKYLNLIRGSPCA